MQSQFNLNLEANECLAQKILEFKADEKKMCEINKFIDGVLHDAEHQAYKHQNHREQIEEFEKNGNNIHRRLVARARGFCLRVFETISNCAVSTSISHLPIRKS